MPTPANPHSRVAVGAAEFFTKILASYFGARRHYGSIAVNAYHHIADIDRIVPQLATPAGGDRVSLGDYVAQWGNGDVIVREHALSESSVSVDRGIFRLALQFQNLADAILLVGGTGVGLQRHASLCPGIVSPRPCRKAKDRDQHQQ